jgi:hypothetical protein
MPPPGYFNAFYTKELAEEEKQLASASVIWDPADFADPAYWPRAQDSAPDLAGR